MPLTHTAGELTHVLLEAGSRAFRDDPALVAGADVQLPLLIELEYRWAREDRRVAVAVLPADEATFDRSETALAHRELELPAPGEGPMATAVEVAVALLSAGAELAAYSGGTSYIELPIEQTVRMPAGDAYLQVILLDWTAPAGGA